ncbi:MAG: CBS domain-containing protein [Promethearchaeota archaeon]
MAKKKPDFYVKDLVIEDEYGIIESDATVVQAAQKMKKLAIPDLVVQEKKTKEVLGVIADFDIVQHVVADGKDPAKELVTWPMYTIEPVKLETNVVDAFERMRDLEVNVVPVVEEKKLLGVVTIQDVWSYIPDENIDEIGMIPVDNPKNAEFWFASVCATLSLVLGILLPLVGAVGFFTSIPEKFSNGTLLHFFLFDAHGADFYKSYIDIAGRNGYWVLVVIWSTFTLIAGILGFFALVYASFSDFQQIRTGIWVKLILPLIMLGAIVLEWIFIGIGMTVISTPGTVSINALGLIFGLLSLLLIGASLKRDWIFRQSESEPVAESTGGK